MATELPYMQNPSVMALGSTMEAVLEQSGVMATSRKMAGITELLAGSSALKGAASLNQIALSSIGVIPSSEYLAPHIPQIALPASFELQMEQTKDLLAGLRLPKGTMRELTGVKTFSVESVMPGYSNTMSAIRNMVAPYSNLGATIASTIPTSLVGLSASQSIANIIAASATTRYQQAKRGVKQKSASPADLFGEVREIVEQDHEVAEVLNRAGFQSAQVWPDPAFSTLEATAIDLSNHIARKPELAGAIQRPLARLEEMTDIDRAVRNDPTTPVWLKRLWNTRFFGVRVIFVLTAGVVYYALPSDQAHFADALLVGAQCWDWSKPSS